MFAPASIIPGLGSDSGGHCKTIYQSEFDVDEEKRLIAVISTSDQEPHERLKTGVRIARHLAESLHPDLVIVQVADHRGPTTRAELRGYAIGAEIVHAPHPAKSRAVSKPWEARYVDALPTSYGYYFGERIDLKLTELEALNQEIEKVEGCDGDMLEGEAEVASASGHEAAAEPAHAAPSGH